MRIRPKDKHEHRLVPIFIAWNENVKQLLISRGYPQNKIIVQQYKFDKPRIKTNPNSKNIVYACCANPTKMSYVMSTNEEIHTIEQIKKHIPSGYTLIIKNHPSLDPTPYKKIKGVKLVVDGTIDDVLKDCCLLITKASGAYYDAQHVGIRAMAVNTTSDLDLVGYGLEPIEKIPFILETKHN